jgi:hypothetical protein
MSLTDNVNFLSPIGFKLVLEKTPNVEYFCTGVTLPDILIGETPFVTATRNVSLYADKLNFDFFTVRMMVDENMTNYREIFDWLNEIVYTDDEDLRDKSNDISLIILNSHNNPVQTIQFTSAFPTSIGSLDFDAKATDVEYLTTEVQFKFTEMKFV